LSVTIGIKIAATPTVIVLFYFDIKLLTLAHLSVAGAELTHSNFQQQTFGIGTSRITPGLKTNEPHLPGCSVL
jgi:hypothetical protein